MQERCVHVSGENDREDALTSWRVRVTYATRSTCVHYHVTLRRPSHGPLFLSSHASTPRRFIYKSYGWPRNF